MMVLITGNVASGKSSVSTIIAEQLRFHRICMDDMREEYNPDGGQEGEELAHAMMLRDIEDNSNIVVEAASQYRVHAYKTCYQMKYPDEPIYEVRLKTDRGIAVKRIKERLEGDYKWPPTPWGSQQPTFEEVMQIFDYIDKQHSFAKLKIDTSESDVEVVVKIIRDYFGV